MKKLCIALLILTSTVKLSAQSKESIKSHVTSFFYRDSVIAIKRYYDGDKKLDSIKTYYKSGELDELFYFNKGRLQGNSVKYNRFGQKLTTWEFKNGKLINRTDHKIEFSKKNKEKVKKYHAQLTELNKKLKVNPNDFKSRYKRAAIRRYFNNNTLALHDFKKIEKRLEKISKTKQIPEKLMGSMYDNLASIYQDYEMKNYTIHYKIKAIRASPKESRLFYNLGYYLVQIKSYRLGIVFLNKAIDMIPGHSFANWSLSVAYTDLKDYEKAMTFVNIAFKNEDNIHRLSMGPSNERDLNTIRGYLYHKLGETNKGIADLQEALNINKTNSFAYRNLGEIYYDLNIYNKACEYLLKAKELGYEKIHDRYDLQDYLDLACKHITTTKIKIEPIKTAKLIDKPFIYPNPTKGNISLKRIPYENFKYFVFDYTGKQVLKGLASKRSINLSHLPTGLYILKILTNNDYETFRVVKE